AGMIGDPYATQLVESGKAVALVDFRQRDAPTRWLGERGVYSGVFARADARLGAAELAPLARALLRAVALIRTANPEDLRSKLPAEAVGFPPEDFILRVAGAREIFLADGDITTDMLKAGIAMVRSHGPIPSKVKLPWNLDQLLLTGPLREVLAA